MVGRDDSCGFKGREGYFSCRFGTLLYSVGGLEWAGGTTWWTLRRGSDPNAYVTGPRFTRFPMLEMTFFTTFYAIINAPKTLRLRSQRVSSIASQGDSPVRCMLLACRTHGASSPGQDDPTSPNSVPRTSTWNASSLRPRSRVPR